MTDDDIFDIACRELLTTSVDDVFDAAGDGDAAFVVDHPQVAGVEPAFGVEVRGSLLSIEIAQHALGTADTQLTLRASRPGRASVGVNGFAITARRDLAVGV